jgi:outer membrane cobalamin receptor
MPIQRPLFLGIFLFMCCMNFSFAQANDQELWDRSLEDLLNMKVVSGTRKEDLSLRIPMIVTVMTSQELKRWGADNLADGLRTAAGLQIRKAPGDFPQYKTAVRGNTADFMNVRTLFLIDGIPVQNPNAGFDPGWIPLSIVKRVEIVKGPASGIYGANAFGGLVNVITRSGQDEDSLAEASIGVKTHKDAADGREVLGHNATLNLGNKNRTWQYFASVQHDQEQNTEKTSAGLQEQDVFGKLRYQATDNLSYSVRSLLSLDRNQLALSNVDSQMKNSFLHVAATVNYRLAENSDFELTGYLNNFTDFLKYNDALDNYENQGKVYGVHSQFSLPLKENHMLTSGLDFSEVSGFLQTNSFDYATFPPSVAAAGWSNQKHATYGLYSQYEYSGWSHFSPLLGVRYDKDTAFGGAWSPRAGLSYLITDQITLYSSVGRGFRAPIFNETNIQGYGKAGNPSLNPEYTTTYEVGIKSVYESAQNTASIFKQDITEQINLVPADAASPNGLKTFQNSGTASIVGFEVDGSYKSSSALRLFYNASLLKSDDGSGKRVERLIEKKIVLGVSWLVSDWKTDLVAVHEGNQFFYNTNASIPSDAEGRVFLPEVTTMNLQGAHDFGGDKVLTLFFNNITDQRYKEAFSSFVNADGFWLPGRTLGLRFNAKY